MCVMMMSRTSCVLILLTLATYSSVANCEQNANATATSRAGRQMDIPRDVRVVRIFLDQQQHLRRPPPQISSRSDHFPQQRLSYGPGPGPYGRPPFGRPKPQQPMPHIRRRVHNGPPGPPPPGVYLHPNGGPPQYNNYQVFKNTRYPLAKGPYVQKGAPVNYYGQSQGNVAPNLNVIPQGHNFKPSPIYNGEVIVRHPSAAPLVAAPPSVQPPQQSLQPQHQQQSEEKPLQQVLRPYKPQSNPPLIDSQHMYSVYEDNDSELENSYGLANIGENAMKEAKQYLNFMSSNEYFLPKIEPDYRKLDQAKQQHQQQSDVAALSAFQQQQQQQLQHQQQQQRNAESSSLNAAFTVNAPLRVSASSSPPQAQAQTGNTISPTSSSYSNRHPPQTNLGSYQTDSNVFVVSSDGIKNVHHIVSTSSYPEGNHQQQQQQQQHSSSIPTFSSGLRPMLKERAPDPERVEFTERDAIHVSYTSNPMDSVSRYGEKQQQQQHLQQPQQQSQPERRYVKPTSTTSIQQQDEEDDDEMMQAASIPQKPKKKKKKTQSQKGEQLIRFEKNASEQEPPVDIPAMYEGEMEARAARVQISAELIDPSTPEPIVPSLVIETSTTLSSSSTTLVSSVPVCSDGNECISDDTKIQRETAKLRAREELLRLRQSVDQLVRDQGVTPPPQPNKIDFTDVEGSIAPFTGDDDYSVQKWISDFEDVMESLHASDTDKYRCARRLMKDTAKIFLRTIRVTTWDELKQAMVKRFERQLSQFEIYERLRKRFRKRDETIDKYIIIMTELAQHGEVREIDLVQMIIAGLQDTSAHISILAGATSIDELLDRVKVYQSAIAAANGAASIMRVPTIVPPLRTTSLPVHPTAKAFAITWPVEQPRCSNCSPPYEYPTKDCSRQKLASGICVFNCGDGNKRYQDCSGSSKTASKRRKIVFTTVSDVTTAAYDTTGVTEDWPETTTTVRRDIYGRVKVNPSETASNPSIEQKDTEEYCERICSNVQDEDEEVVCGSDGFMYTSEAQMECYASCLHIDVTIQSKGTCNQSL